MSIDINWETITSGPDGEKLAESIRSFIHEKFQQVALPRFIRSVEVHSFDFGKTCPAVEIKDIGDPFPDFYEDDGGGDEGQIQSEAVGEHEFSSAASIDRDQGLGLLQQKQQQRSGSTQNEQHHQRSFDHAASNYSGELANATSLHDVASHSRATHLPPQINTTKITPTALRSPFNHLADQITSSFPRSGTPGTPGGTSNLSYFHLPIGGLSGTQTPLAAVASGTNLTAAAGWPPDLAHDYPSPRQNHTAENDNATSTRPSTASTLATRSPPFPDHGRLNPTQNPHSQLQQSPELQSEQTFPHPHSPSDLQVAFQLSYIGDTHLTLTAEILLDYPMPSFVSIPLKLSITGLTFDGVGVLASIGRKLCFCFLGDEDAEVLLGRTSSRSPSGEGKEAEKPPTGGLLQEIKVESEIGRQENGKQVLKNVGKVEKFVLEQVRKIFEDEFVWPSFWTVLV